MTRPLRSAVLLAAVLALPACADGKKVPGTPPLPPGTSALAEKARLDPPKATQTCYSSPVRTVFHSKQEWDGYWRGNNPTCTPPPAPAGVDWSREMVAYASMGLRMSTLDRISIDGSGVRNDSVIVVVRRYMANESCGGPKAATFPQSLVKLPADTLPLRFSEAHVKIPCDQPTGQ